MYEKLKTRLLGSKFYQDILNNHVVDLVFIGGSRLVNVHGENSDFDLVVVCSDITDLYEIPERLVYEGKQIHWYYNPYEIISGDCNIYPDNLMYRTSLSWYTLLNEDTLIEIRTVKGQELYNNLCNNNIFKKDIIKKSLDLILCNSFVKSLLSTTANTLAIETRYLEAKSFYRVLIVFCLYLNINYNIEFLKRIKEKEYTVDDIQFCISVILEIENKYCSAKLLYMN